MAHGSIKACIMALATFSVLACCTQEAPRNSAPSPEAAVPQAVTEQRLQTGAVLFKQFCSNCHPDGGNVSDPDRTLHDSALRAHHITTPDDIIRIMRNPISRMITFDTSTISDKEAHIIAGYVLTTFK